MTLPAPPPVIGLTYAQCAGWACCFCGAALTSGAVSAGISRGRLGAHTLDTEVYACPECATPPHGRNTS